MNNELLREELTKTLEGLYDSLPSRIHTETWVETVSKAYREDPVTASAAVIDFMQSHCYMPADVATAVYKAIELRDHPARMAAVYGSGTIDRLYAELTREPAITFSKLPYNITEEDAAEVVDSARECKRYLDRGQVHLAQTSLGVLKSLCPDNQEINDLYIQFIEMRSTAGVPAYRFRNVSRRRPGIDRQAILSMLQEGNLEEAVGAYEKAIADDYKNYEAYYALGNLYLLQDEDGKADYIAELLLDTGREAVMALLLKGRVLEARGQLEDALYYYDSAVRKAPKDDEAAALREHVLKRLEGAEAEDEDANRFGFIRRTQEHVSEFAAVRISSDILNLVEETDALISRGRLTEAYYELVKKAEDTPGSSYLLFKQGYALYLMEREQEARQVLKSIQKGDALYERARYLLTDIDRNITDNGKFEDIPPVEIAEILFACGEYRNALEILNSMDVSAMNAEAWSIKGRCEIEMGTLSNALDSFNNALEADYHVENVREMIAMIYQAGGEYDRALELYDQAIKLSPAPETLCNLKASLLNTLEREEEMQQFRTSTYALLGKACDADGYAGLLMLQDEDTKEEGLQHLKAAVDNGSAVVDFYAALADAFTEKEEYYRAMLCVDAGIVNSNVRDVLVEKKAEILHRQGRNDLAEVVTEGLLRQRPEAPELHYLNGMIKHALGQERESIQWLKSAVGLDHDSHDYLFALAESYNRNMEYDNALFYYTKAIMLDEDDCVAFKRRASIYYRKNQDQKALDDINRAMLLDPNDPENYVLIGNILSGYEVEEYIQIEGAESAGDVDSASDDIDVDANYVDLKEENESEILNDLEKDSEYYYTKALSYDPTYIDGYICRAKYYMEHGKADKALADIDTALAIEPDSARLFMLRGIICHLSGKNDLAVENFEKVAAEDRDNLTAYSYLAKCYNALGRYDDALKAANDGLRRNDEFTNLYVNRGVTLYHLGRYDDAIEDFNKVLIRKNQVNTAAIEATYKFKGLAFEKLGRKEEAVTDFKMLLRYDPQSAGIKAHIEELEEDILEENSTTISRLFRRRKDK